MHLVRRKTAGPGARTGEDAGEGSTRSASGGSDRRGRQGPPAGAMGTRAGRGAGRKRRAEPSGRPRGRRECIQLENHDSGSDEGAMAGRKRRAGAATGTEMDDNHPT